MKVSIIVLTYNNKALTIKCLKALFANTPKIYLDDVLVVDNASADGTQDYLKKQKGIRIFLNKENLGFSKGNNFGASEAKGEILIFLNNDTEVRKGWLLPMLEIIKKKREVGAVGAKLLFPDGTIQHAGVVISEDRIPRHIYYQDNPKKSYVNKEREYKAVTAACVAIPKTVFEKVKGFDEEYVNGLEDVDLCLRIRKAGYSVWYSPKSVVYHHEKVAPGRFKYNDHNYRLYMQRWGGEEPDEHQYMINDGFSKLQIFWHDLASMSYSWGEGAKTPIQFKFLRYLYLPYQKITTAIKLLAKGDIKTLNQKVKKVFKNA